MTGRMPPVPPQNRSPKGTGEAKHTQDRGNLPDLPRMRHGGPDASQETAKRPVAVPDR